MEKFKKDIVKIKETVEEMVERVEEERKEVNRMHRENIESHDEETARMWEALLDKDDAVHIVIQQFKKETKERMDRIEKKVDKLLDAITDLLERKEKKSR